MRCPVCATAKMWPARAVRRSRSFNMARIRKKAQATPAKAGAKHEMEKAINPRKTLVVISDGGDNNSAFSAKEVLQKALESGVQIYAMGVFESLGPLGLR